ncbi:MAG: ATP-dependent DNA helicase [Lachnospiraceae bacterium]|nr:ATP-dependent DNA helicase [Lachnospiraceae bacterium]
MSGQQKRKEAAEKRAAKPVSRISVRTLVEFLLRSGDIDRGRTGVRDMEAAREGARIHRKIQKSEGPEYSAEVSLSIETEFDDLVIRTEGRADGVIRHMPAASDEDAGETFEQEAGKTSGQEAVQDPGDDPEVTVDEIKSMYQDVGTLKEPHPLHLAQAKCYAHILCHDEDLSRIGVRMTYVCLENEQVQYFHYTYDASELEEWFGDLMREWHRWAAFELRHREERNASIERLTFPFPWRKGQQGLTAAVYRTICDEGQLFLMAPTGVGKTMSCVYPSVRALGEGRAERIFYLTAKNETLRVGMEAFSILDRGGLDFRTIRLTSRDKICPMSEAVCSPDSCPFAKGHFDRVGDALFDLIRSERLIDRETLLRYAEERTVCPFELGLDAAVWCDAVCCDYNYVFDPNARLQRFFAGGGRNGCIFLIDETHNLVERGRDMYSASLVKEHVLSAKRALSDRDPRIKKQLGRLNRILLALKKDTEESPSGQSAGRAFRFLSSSEMQPLLRESLHLAGSLQEYFRKDGGGPAEEDLLNFYFELLQLNGTADGLDEHYVTYAGETEEGTFAVRLFCTNPAGRLTEALSGGTASILFSATLLPIDYYRQLLTEREEAKAVYAESPFDTGRRLLLIGTDVTTRYAARGREMNVRTARYLYETASARTGNYLAFFPSYKMMRDVLAVFRELYGDADVNYVAQSAGMRDDDREIFMENFYENPRTSLIGFVVLGGMFAEGIDLTGERLIGAVVVGAGIPQVSAEREILKKAADDAGLSGFDYAYRFPGMNKVAQAAGRVIRTAKDAGVIVLLDDRLTGAGYRRLFPREWRDFEMCTLADAGRRIRQFWETQDMRAECSQDETSPDEVH